MPTLEQIDHLIGALGAASWQEQGLTVPLVWAEADPAERAHMVAGPHDDWAPVTETTIWGRPQSYFWFGGTFRVPEALDGADLWLRIDAQFGRVMGRSDPQCLVRVNGKIVQGGDYNHRLIHLSDAAVSGVEYALLVEAGTIEDRRQIGFGLEVLTRDAEMEALYFDLLSPTDVARHLPENDHRRDLILTTIYEALNTVDLRPGNPARRAASVAAAREIAARIYATADTEARPTVTVTGHTHIDVAWLWRVRETRQKMARSVATALTLMEAYPDYVFMYNQGYLLDTLSKDYPELFDGLKARQQAGQVEIEGALWLEPDANMTSGESLVRHIIKGIAYHQEQFGVRPRIVWLPDTFGYSSALPQIMAQSGLEVFVTHKMSWNDTNRMPNEIFWWEGVDGTRVPTYFLTTQPMESNSIGTTYCPDLRPSHVMGAWRRFGQKETGHPLWMVYGHGDGGGGPTREMLEHIRRMEAGIPGCPKVVHGPMGPFFDELVAGMKADPGAYPSWVGELYLEFHRGTFTSVAEVKRNNRKAEAAMREIEALAVLAMARGEAAYPGEEIAALWDVVLLNQFHDILPGSSIPEVYEDSREEFAQFFTDATALKARLAGALGGGLVTNPLGADRTGLLWCDGEVPVSVDGVAAQAAVRADGTRGQIAPVADVPALGARGVEIATGPGAQGDGGLVVAPDLLENDRVAVRFDEAGRLVSLTDKASGREVLAGPANRLVAFRDLPVQFDAWDIDETYKDQFWEVDDLVSAEVVETGPYRAAIRFDWRYERSRIVQVVSLEAGASHVEIDCAIDWAEPHTLLKAEFPLAIRTSSVVAETQFGHVTRPTHRNTSWDAARFEHPMHRWVAMQEEGLAVSLMNDCKYGYDAQDQTIRLTMLRAPTWPWDGADIGAHQMRYAVGVHGALGEVPALAEAFNAPLALIGASADAAGEIAGLIALDTDGVAVEAVKRSEDGQAVIVRLWERQGRRQKVDMRFDPQVTSVARCSLLEEPEADLALGEGNTSCVGFEPFRIVTLRLDWRGNEMGKEG